ncbi:hypothetical protein JCM16138_14380 [Thermococcus atlanticus]
MKVPAQISILYPTGIIPVGYNYGREFDAKAQSLVFPENVVR